MTLWYLSAYSFSEARRSAKPGQKGNHGKGEVKITRNCNGMVPVQCFQHRTGDDPKQMVHTMSQAFTNIAPTSAFCKAAPQPTQRQSGAQHTGRKPRPATSADQKTKLSAAQLAYIANDPRWIEHRRKLAAAQEARRMTLFENEVTAILEMRKRGRTFSYISEEIGVCRDVITRELAALGIATGRVRMDRRARRGKGYWRSFD